MVKPAGQKRFRRGRKKANCKIEKNSDNKFILYYLNIRGLNSKKNSFENVIGRLSPAVITLNETFLKHKQKPNLKDYVSHDRNRISEAMGGIATLVRSKDKDSFLKISEGNQNDEFLVTRHLNFIKPLNIVNIYGEQESRTSNSEIEERWGRILNEILKLESRNEFILIVGDLNKHIGNDELGVKDNHSKISFGGKYIRDLLSGGNYICMNNSKKA